MNAADRFFAKVAPGPNGCLLWTGALDSNGYGRFQDVGGRNMPAHRWLWERVLGRMEGLVADHLCRNPACVRPAHIEFVTQQENVRRGIGPARIRSRAAARTHCSRGHLLTEENTYRYVNARDHEQRYCRTCRALVRDPAARRAYQRVAQRRWRRNHAVLAERPRVAILHGPQGPLVQVEVFAGDSTERLEAEREKAIEVYNATVRAVRG